MLLRPVCSPPPPRLLPACPSGAAPATAALFPLILRRRQRRRHRHRPYPLLRASLSDLLASLPASLALVGPAAVAAVAAVASSFSGSSYVRNGLPPPPPLSPEPDSDYGACGDAAGEWILFTSPTPFNRCVLLRCPSVSFEDGGLLLDGVNERLLTEERHYVNLSRGRIPAARGGDAAADISYQRICIPLEDGGVIALDWPDNLDLDKEHGLDSTVFIVPGTPEGSMERGIKVFVLDALKNGYFPIVMNPRGCGGSPLTTPRLFTAADSDDICTAIRFINNKRPWTTLMGVGWGYGANMLTKYLVEVGESTPLTAAVCVDNPFDLQEATRSFPHHISLDRKLTTGLVDILHANKELFQGKDKDFNVQKALSSNCLRDFDGAISMVSHGFSTVDDFYSESSTRLSIAHVKIPVLFIQSDDGTVPLLSVPRSSISENPFTSLLLCSCVHSTVFTFERYAVLWCQNLALEWLSAVEFALLKGRHPLIKDVDITINPSKGLAFVEPQANDRKVSNNTNFHQQSQFILYNSMPHGINGLLLDSAKERSGSNKKENSQVKDNGDIDRARKDVYEEESEDTTEDDEKGHVLQSASLVMNMLDATMPGTLDDDQKKKVLVAVEQGESLVKALEEAVPEDVRGKLTTSVTEILQSKRGNFSLDALKRLGWTNGRSNTKPAVQEKVKDSDRESGLKDAKMHDQNKSASAIGDVDQKDGNLTSNDNNSGEGIELSQGKPSQTSGPIGAVTEMGTEQIQPNRSEKTIPGINESSEDQHKTDQGTETAPKQVSDDQSPSEKKISDDQSPGEKKVSDDQSTANLNGAPRERVQSTDATAETPQAHVVEKEGDAVRASEDKATHNVTDQSMQVSKTEEPKPPPVNVTQALDALTGFDDSTQMAVNSVFGVIENMIDQFEKQHESENGDKSDGSTDEASVNKTESQVTGDMNNESIGKSIIPSSYQPENSISGEGHSIMSEERTIGETNSNLSIISSAKEKTGNYQRNIIENYVDADVAKQGSGLPDYLLDIAVNSYLKAQYAMYLHEFLSTQLQLKSPDLNSATDLFLDPQEGKWKIADQMDSAHDYNSKSDKDSSFTENVDLSGSSREPFRTDNVIETPYLVLSNFPVSRDKSNESKHTVATKLPDIALRETLTSFIRDELENALKIEVGRKVGVTNTEQLERNLAHDVERLATQVSRTVVLNCELYSAACVQRNPTTVKFGTTHGENVIEAVSNAIQQSHDLRNILPVGVIVGVTLASLRNYFHVGISKNDKHTKTTAKSVILNEDPDFKTSLEKEESTDDASSKKEENANNASLQKEENANDASSKKAENADNFIKKTGAHKVQEITRSEGQGMMVGAVTAALGASAFVAHHQQKKVEKHDNMDSTTTSDQHRPDETAQEKSQNNLVTSLAEKAMSVASPVVPTKGDGEVDHERLVAVLAELGQKGGALKFVGKIALLWGGIRGAMSLTDRLISFLHISERPLFQRIMGFSFMVLVLWSPVVIPLLPTLVQSWTISSSTGIVGYACIVGLYVSIMMLVILWGKRIRGYENPVEQYGMNLASASRVQEFFHGLAGGITVVGLVHSVSILLGFATLRAGSYSLVARPLDLLKSSSNVLLLALRGFVTATSIAVVEEVVFRSWLPEEIAVDLGYYSAILISGVAFSLIHRSLPSVPGFLLLSLVLFGLKQRTQGKLAAPIGLRSGIMTASYLIQTSGIIQTKPGTPFWMVSTYHLHPFDGVIGLSICALLAILFFPQEPVQKDTFVS
ncbi:hypothetical protein E2562_025358 [Oryza meyeriana var. granulata]|uniref:AB hydrolase-1 domain-containing protein n=1 Tax=Oryza meyeriana var. granulata TaxID=110450 RepID=A0A6G1DQJ4_9ORYZ|nr:hypothetical protein E2562_025358 [Oryza meyeriana var. granulata]